MIGGGGDTSSVLKKERINYSKISKSVRRLAELKHFSEFRINRL